MNVVLIFIIAKISEVPGMRSGALLISGTCKNFSKCTFYHKPDEKIVLRVRQKKSIKS